MLGVEPLSRPFVFRAVAAGGATASPPASGRSLRAVLDVAEGRYASRWPAGRARTLLGSLLPANLSSSYRRVNQRTSPERRSPSWCCERRLHVSAELTHVDASGAARMVDVSAKPVTVRTATASGSVRLSPTVVALLRGAGVPKGDALAVARIAGIQAAKRTPDLVPLCHPIAIHGVTVDLAVRDDRVDIAATVRTADRTGVEMEALTCVSVAGLALVDMVKAVDPAATITDVRVDTKTGGASGDWARPR
jgi:cyclic pyranopterin phosphate synthase